MIKSFKAKKTAHYAAVFFSIILLHTSGVSGQKLESLDSELSSIIGKVSQTVVTVEARHGTNKAPLYPGNTNAIKNPVRSIVGSGVIFDTLGHILTIESLVDGYDYYQVDIDGQQVQAELVGIDRRLNLAVLKLVGVRPAPIEISPFPPLAGRLALAYGRSIGNTGFPSLGVIAGKHTEGNFLMSGTVLPGLLGGGIFDLTGRLIGIISAGNISSPELQTNIWGGIVMVPSATALASAERIMNFGNKDAGYLGVQTTSIELVSDRGTVMGEAVVIADVASDSPASRAGLLIGDIITRFAHQPVFNERQLQQMVTGAGADSLVTIEYTRGQRRFSISVSLSVYPRPDLFAKAQAESQGGNQEIVAAFEIQQRIDSMKVEMRRLQAELNKLISRFSHTR